MNLLSQSIQNSLVSKILKNNFFTNHIFIIIFFILLTGIFTFPSFFEFDKMVGVGGDIYIVLNNFWWFNYNIENNFDLFDLHWIFYHDYQFYPIGAPTGDAGTLSLLLSIPLVLFIENLVHVYNIIVYASFIFTGYGMFHLAKHLTKNYFSAIVAGIAFAFSSFHLFHGYGHLNLLGTEFIPLTVLFFFKTMESKKLRYPIFAGIFLFLSLISSIYLGFFMGIFIILFILYLVISKEKISSFIRLGMVLLIGIIPSLLFYVGHMSVNKSGIATGAPLSGFNVYSSDFASFFIPSPIHNIFNLSIFPIFGNAESWSFLGYATIFLVILALVKTDKRKTGLWIFSGIIFALISMGPILKIFGTTTIIPLPDYFLYHLPFFDIFRAIGRAGLYVHFAFAILAAYGLNTFFKITSISKNTKILIALLFIFIIFVSSLGLPYPTKDFVTVPDYYYTIANDPRDVVLLDVPLGRGSDPIIDSRLFDDWQQFQIIHEKPYYGGHQSRVPDEAQSHVRTYFLNQFIGDQPITDIVIQDIHEVGISILNHLNVGYVILHYPPYQSFVGWDSNASTIWFPQTKLLLSEIFSKPPDFDNLKPSTPAETSIIGYSVPTSTSKIPFILLGDGWRALNNDARLIGNVAEIKIINPSDTIKKTELHLELSSILDNKIKLLFNNIEISSFTVNATTAYHISTDSLDLVPGINYLTLYSDNVLSPTINLDAKKLAFVTPELRGDLSMFVTHVSLNSNNITSFTLEELNHDVTAVKEILIGIEINNLYMKILERPVDIGAYVDGPSKILSGKLTYDQLKEILFNSDEYERLQLKSLFKFG
jgi:hypothetical protein